MLDQVLTNARELWIHQKRELAEFFGFETRNKYAICDSTGTELFYAAEQSKGFLGLLVRQFLGHWRTFEVHIFDSNRQLVLKGVHPFRLLFQRFEVFDEKGLFLGALQGRFALLYKRFDVEDKNGKILAQVKSPLWHIWTFPFTQGEREVAVIKKKWAGLFSEALTDKDRFQLVYSNGNTELILKKLILAAGLFIDLQYFEKKANS